MTKDRTTAGALSTSSSSSWFLGCFGCSGKKIQHKAKVNSGNRRRWIPKWNFRFNKSTNRLIPVNLTTVPRKSKSKNGAPATSDKTWEIQVVEEDATLTKKPVIMVEEQNSLRRKKCIYSVNTQNWSYRSRRKETKAAGDGFDLPGKRTVMISHAIVSSPLKPLTHSASLPPPAKKKKPPQSAPASGRVDGGGVHKTTPSDGGSDSIIGMSVILVILVIMVLWGKLCAILCTSAWFFIAPRLEAAGEEYSAVVRAEKRRPESHDNLDMQSVEYKKKVVLEGLLQRNNRNTVGRL